MTHLTSPDGGAATRLAGSAPDLVALMAQMQPHAAAIAAPCGTMSYGALDAEAARLAGYLAAGGVGAGDVVAICLDRSAAGIVAALAAWRIGAAYLPLDPAWPDARLAAIAAEAGIGALIARREGLARLAGLDVRKIALDDDAAAIAAAKPVPYRAADPAVLAYVIYTSGSTGAPKGVEISHANLAALIAWHLDAFAPAAGERCSHLAGLGFDAAVWEVWPTLAAGACLALVPEAARTDPAALRGWLVAERIAIAFAPPALAEPLLAMEWPADTNLRLLLTGADVLRQRPRPGLPFALVNNYGPTECTVVATSGTVASKGDALPTIGAPIRGTLIRVLDPAGNPVADGEPGELCIGGASVGIGYRGRPDLTAERFVTIRGERLYRTGDLGIRLPTGEIAFRGRADDQIKVRGHRVEPAEIERVLANHPAVAACTVGMHDDALVAWLAIAGEAPDAETMRDFTAARLPDYMVPACFVALAALPLGASGKIDRAALPAPDDRNRLASSAFAAPESVAELRLAEIVRTALGHASVGLDDNFFLLGGHSLLGTQVVLRANEAFGVDLSLRDLFQAPTIRQLGARIEERLFAMLDAMSDEDALRQAAR